MESSTDDALRPEGISVWCTRCNSNLRGTAEAIISHFKHEHGRSPTTEEITRILLNKKTPKLLKKRKKSKVRGMPSSRFVDPDAEHNIRWSKVIQGGAPGLGKKK